MNFRTLLFLLSVLGLFSACNDSQELIVDHSDSNIEYTGRIASSLDTGTQLFWPGTSIKLNFEGTAIAALMQDDTGDSYYNVMIDNGKPEILRPDTSQRYHQLATDLAPGKHTLEIFKRTEYDKGNTSFYNFKISSNPKLLPKTPAPKRKIEFYGNSITAGYAIEDTTGKDSPKGTFTNNYASYAALTARHFDAEYHCICRSGIGVTVSWMPVIMPELYDRLDPSDPNSKWDFSLYDPDVVVINLFQNDSWLVEMPESEEYELRFSKEVPTEAFLIDHYQQFVAGLRAEYPAAHIICSLGCMDASKEGSKWINYINTAVSNLKDSKIHTYIIPHIPATAHPSVRDNQEMAKGLIQFIEEHVEW